MSDRTVPQGAEPAIERRLATILMADVAGYSRMMGENEERTVQILQGHREIFDALLKAHRGRIFNTAGDAILAEFPSAVEAVRCATEIQTALRTRNDHLPADERMSFRIGVNLGDVIVQGGDLLGDGVNVAARIQTIAEPGGVCTSGSVYDQIRNKLTLQIRQLGEKSFKNIAQPVRTFSISDEGGAMPATRLRPRKAPMIVAALAGLVAVGAGGVWLYRDYSARAAEDARRAEDAKRAAEEQAKTDREMAMRATADREAKLLAELKSAKDALTQAEASKRKGEQDKLAAAAAVKPAEAPMKAEPDRAAAAPAPVADAEPRPAPVAAKGAAKASASKGIDRFDGAHIGRMCTVNTSNAQRCWGVVLNVKHGALSATWTTRFTEQPAHLKGEIAADGTVSLALDGHSPKGRALAADVKGTVVDNKLSFAGVWSNGSPISGTWFLNP
ncbi:MAG TPA: adenylate/guanylate cyclase domain-containing protein [Casimicrobiaceae bacterium]|nr:adenylate/guanylate cyclase domain-containing protein [Casimicrobiaceae bacterium]